MSDKTVWSKYTKKQLGELNVFAEEYRQAKRRGNVRMKS